MIIVEGPDGSGKSTLIEKLNHRRKHLRALRGGRGADGKDKQGWGGGVPALTAYTTQIFGALDEESGDAISMAHGLRPTPVAFDRFHLSEVVYGPILRGKQEIVEADLIKLNSVLRMMKIPVIMCLPPLETTLENVFKEGRHLPAYQTEEFLRQAYAEFQRLTPWATIVYDFTRDPLPAVSVNAD